MMLGQHAGIQGLGAAEQFQRAAVARLWPRGDGGPIRFQIMVVDVRFRRHRYGQCCPIARKSGVRISTGVPGQRAQDGADGGGEVGGPAAWQVVAVDAGDDSETQTEFRDCGSRAFGLAGIQAGS